MDTANKIKEYRKNKGMWRKEAKTRNYTENCCCIRCSHWKPNRKLGRIFSRRNKKGSYFE